MSRFLLLLAALLPAIAIAKTPTLTTSKAALSAAQQAAATHKTAAAAAHGKALADAAKAAILADQQITAAAALRQLENQTGDDAANLASLQAQSAAAAAKLAASEAALAKLLPIMQRLATQPAGIMLAMPGSPIDAIRGIIIMHGIAAAIEQQAVTVKQQSSAVTALRLQNAAQQQALAIAVAAQQTSEDDLSRQIAAAKTAEMADATIGLTETAAAIAANRRIQSLQGMIEHLTAAQHPTLPEAQIHVIPGSGGAPVAGNIIEHFGDSTMAGPATGVSYRAAPGARVVTPCTGPVLFANKFQAYGMVVIVDCENHYDFVLSGMQHLDVSTGQRLRHGQPVGEMLGYDPSDPARQPVLYVELRHNGAAVDPASWFGKGGSG